MTKKILILTLGVGKNNNINHEIEKFNFSEMNYDEMSKVQCYQEATYSIEGKIEKSKSPFIADRLLDIEKVDEVIVLGTVKSSFLPFFLRFCDESWARANEKRLQNMASYLYDIWTSDKYGKDTNKEDLKIIQEKISQIFEEGKVCQNKINGSVRVVLTMYGMNKEELNENYTILTESIKDILDENKENEISFDITHSFRSLPIYNLIIFQYLKNVTKYKVKITHVYYGNLEVNRENKGISPIVDLESLVNIMNLTNGINEFKNTGNAKTLISYIEEEKLREVLLRFDWATQINFYDNIIGTLEELIKEINKDSNKLDSYRDLNNMIRDVLVEKFGDGSSENIISDNFAENQYKISKWNYQQNRYGIAIATAIETLKSFLVPIYLKTRNKEVSEESCKKEDNRRNAVQELKNIAKQYKDNELNLNEYEKFFINLEEKTNIAKKVRDRFAHALSGGPVDNIEYNDAKKIIDDFMQELSKLREYLRTNESNIIGAYNYKAKYTKNNLSNKKNIRVIITDNYQKNFSILKLSHNKKYELYLLPDKVKELFKEKDYIYNSLIISEYLKSHFNMEISIILDVSGKDGIYNKQRLYDCVVLYEEGFKTVLQYCGDSKKVEPAIKLPLAIDYKDKIKEFSQDDMKTIKEKEPTHIRL